MIGNATDTNNNFVSGDYAETGTTAGLKGNATTKSLATGLVPSSALTLGNVHLSAMIATAPTSANAFPCMVSAQSASALFQIVGYQANTSTVAYYVENAAGGDLSAAVNPTGLFIGSSVSVSDRRIFLNGSQSGSTGTSTNTSPLPSVGMSVFANNNYGTIGARSDARLSTFSIGRGMTAAQVAAYNTALAAFRAALGRA